MNRTIEEWIGIYNKKIPEGFKRDERFTLFYLPDKGICEIMDTGKMIIANQTCGELKFWRRVIESIARKLGRTHAGTICIRKILPYIRLSGFKVERIEETEQGNRYFGVYESTGQRGQASPAGENTYYVTWEVNGNGI